MEDTPQHNPKSHSSYKRRNRSKRKRPQSGHQTDSGTSSNRAKTAASGKGENGRDGLPNGGGGDGGHILGNFPRYYDFHPAAPRLQPLLVCPEALDAIFGTAVQARRAFVMADLGCNDGTLTLLLAQELRAELERRLRAGQDGKPSGAASSSPTKEDPTCKSSPSEEQGQGVRLGVLGMDIDEVLLQRARDTAAGIAQPPSDPPSTDPPKGSASDPCDQPSSDAADDSKPPPSDPSEQSSGASQQPMAPLRDAVVRFKAADLGAEEDPLAPILDEFFPAYHASLTPSSEAAGGEGQGQVFDLLTIFSTTMWVHLNHGDEGLQRFLRRAASRASCLLIEPQEWSSYKSAQRRLKRLGLSESPHYQTISRRETPKQTLMRVLCQEGGMRFHSLGKTSAWKRDLILFHR